MNEPVLMAIGQALRAANRIMLTCHVRPDGDAIGSLLGLGLALQEAGKQVQMVSRDGVPSSLRHLPGSAQVVQQRRASCDLSVVLDCSDLKRTGGTIAAYGVNDISKPDVNIDHHITNLKYARLNLVRPEAVATAEILVGCLPAWDLPISAASATALLTGIITDTLGFRTMNMTPAVMRTVAVLMEKGINMPELYHKALVQRSFEAVRLWGEGLSKLERDERMVWTTLTQAERQVVGYPGRDDADLINILSSINGADVGIIFVEQTNGTVKVSWRSVPGVDVSQVALRFGGGGHPAAAGAEILGDLEDVQFNVLQATRKLLEINAAGMLQT